MTNDSPEASVCGKPVLISGNEEYFRIALHAILTDRLGVSEVLETATFDEAIDCLSTHAELAMALFVLDTPELENWVELRHVRDLFPDVRVVVVSASQDRHDILMSLESGVHGYVSKAVCADEMTAATHQICSGVVYIPPSFPDLPCPMDTTTDLSASDGAHPNHLRVTPRQTEIIKLLVAGKSNKAMARTLDLSEGTIKFHLSSTFRLLNATNRVEAATAGARLLQEIAADNSES